MENTIEISQTIGVNLSLDIRQPSRFFHLRLGDVTSQLLKPNLSGFKHSRVDKAVDNYPLFYPIVADHDDFCHQKTPKTKSFSCFTDCLEGFNSLRSPFRRHDWQYVCGYCGKKTDCGQAFCNSFKLSIFSKVKSPKNN